MSSDTWVVGLSAQAPGAGGGTHVAPASPGGALLCQRCGFPVPDRRQGCKNPCANCGTVYPLGDCSD